MAGINFDKYDDIPVEVSVGCPEPYTEFTEETVGKSLMKNLVLSKYHKPTPVQKYSIPIGMTGGDMMACAQTGSGKTAGFLFPVIAMLLKEGPLPEPPPARPAEGADAAPCWAWAARWARPLVSQAKAEGRREAEAVADSKIKKLELENKQLKLQTKDLERLKDEKVKLAEEVRKLRSDLSSPPASAGPSGSAGPPGARAGP